MRIGSAFVLLGLIVRAGLAAAEPAPAYVAHGFEARSLTPPSFAESTPDPPRPLMVSALALDGELLADGRSMLAPEKKKEEKEKKPKKSRSMESEESGHGVLSPERARVMLQSMTVPGWGQATVGSNRAAAAFLVAEAAIWGSFTSFRIQQVMRRESYERTALQFAGIDLRGRDEEFRRIVGSYSSSDEYNRLVVRRDAANLYYGDPAAYEAYVAAHSLRGADTWSWSGEQAFDRYASQRKDTQRAGLRANTSLALAVANRIVSAIHAARIAPKATAPRTTWNLEYEPVGDDPTAFRMGLRATF